jgi:hypothetical protein
MSTDQSKLTKPRKRSILRDAFFEQDKNGSWEFKWSTFQALAIVVGIVLVLLYSLYNPPIGRTFSISILMAGVALAMGILVGFIFGVPKAASQPVIMSAPTNPTQPPPQTGGDQPNSPKFTANTNLEQISDWLTKIIVGVGLVQLTTIPGKLRALADYFATAFGTQAGQAVPASVIMAIHGYFGIFGFLLGYLWARLYLMEEFSENS